MTQKNAVLISFVAEAYDQHFLFVLRVGMLETRL